VRIFNFLSLCLCCLEAPLTSGIKTSCILIVLMVFAHNSCLKEGAEEFLIKPVKISDVKRLRSYIRPSTKAPCSGSGETLGPSPICSKRKVGSLEGLQVKSNPESQPCLNGVVVA
jgi:hypothetical protein